MKVIKILFLASLLIYSSESFAKKKPEPKQNITNTKQGVYFVMLPQSFSKEFVDSMIKNATANKH